MTREEFCEEYACANECDVECFRRDLNALIAGEVDTFSHRANVAEAANAKMREYQAFYDLLLGMPQKMTIGEVVNSVVAVQKELSRMRPVVKAARMVIRYSRITAELSESVRKYEEGE